MIYFLKGLAHSFVPVELMRIASYLTVFLLAATFAVAGPPDKFSKIRAFVPNREALTKIWDAGVDFEGTDGKVGSWMEFTVGPHERQELDARKIAYDVVVDDEASRLTEGLAPGPRDVFGFGLGSNLTAKSIKYRGSRPCETLDNLDERRDGPTNQPRGNACGIRHARFREPSCRPRQPRQVQGPACSGPDAAPCRGKGQWPPVRTGRSCWPAG